MIFQTESVFSNHITCPSYVTLLGINRAHQSACEESTLRMSVHPVVSSRARALPDKWKQMTAPDAQNTTKAGNLPYYITILRIQEFV